MLEELKQRLVPTQCRKKNSRFGNNNKIDLTRFIHYCFIKKSMQQCQFLTRAPLFHYY